MKQHNLSAKEREKLLDPFPVESAIAPTLNNRTLPYEELDGLRFERLCYEILCSEGKNPRYNGNSGQQDYGVDIVTEHQDTVTVYQCKNIKDRQSPEETVKDIKSAYSKVMERWVCEQKLPVTQFVYYSRQKLASIKKSKEYTPWRDSAFKEHGIDIQLWGRENLDSKLRDLPSVVSGVFSDKVALIFCNENSLPPDSNWERLQYAKSEYPTLRDFYADWKKDKLFINPDLKEWFSTAISASSVVLLQGVPGTGKTTTTLSLLATLNNRPERIYYTVISNFEKIPQMLDSVKKRAQLPSVFILDDCHSAPDLAVELIQRLRGSLLNPNHTVPIKFVLLMRGTPEEDEDTYSDSIKPQLELDEGSAKSIPPSDSKQLLQVLKKRLPHINPITKCHAEHIFNLTGGNLKLAILAVDGIDSADELLRLDGSSGKQNVHRLYISGKNDEDRQCMKNLCALAMFDITPLTDYLVLSEDVLGTGLVTRLYRPKRVRFSHSSLAEVLFYVLVDMDEGVPDNWNERIKQELIRYFEYLCVERQSQLDSFFLNLSSSQLYFPDFDIDRIVSEFVGSSEFKTLLTSEPLAVRVSVLRRLVAKASLGTSEAIKAINDAICRQLKYLYSKTEAWNEKELTDFSNGIFGLRKSSPDHLRFLESQLTVDQLITKLRQSFYIFELFNLLDHSSPSRAVALIDALESTDIDALVDKTIEQQHSVGTLNLALRDLGQKTVEIDGKQMNLLTTLEQIVTVRHLRKLIVNNGTVLELFNLLKHSSPSRAVALIDALESTDIDVLVDKTIELRRSVGTLGIALRDMGQKTVEIDGKQMNLLTTLEQIVTVRHLRKLIVNNGTIFELFGLLKHSSPSRAVALIGALDSSDIDALVDKTVEQRRSVGTLNMALRDLGQKTVKIDGEELNLLTALEQIVTVRHLRKLIVNNGTVFELFNLLQHSSPSRTVALIDALDSTDIDALVDKTVEQQRSVGTLDMALRDLGQKTVKIDGEELNLLAALEQIVTARHLRELIVNNGTVFELFMLLKHSSPSRAGALINALDSTDIDALVDKTAEQQRSIESLHYTFQSLRRYRSLLEELLKVLSPPIFARLIVRAGTLNSLMLISSQLPEKYLSDLRVTISQYPRDKWQKLVIRGLPSNLVNFLSQDIEHYPDAVRNLLYNIVASEGTRFLKKSSWYELNAANHDSDEPITTILREQLEHLLASIPADELIGLDFKEATSAVSIMWRHATSQHDFLNARIWELLPPQRQWPKDYGFGFLSNVIQHICHKDFNRQNAEKLLCKASDHALQVDWTKASPLLLFRFFWHLWQASYHLSVPDPSQYFPEALSDKAIDLLKKLLSKKKYQNCDKITLYALAGLLLFIRPEKERELRGIVKGRLTGLYYLRDEIRTALGNNSLGFVAAYFALYGMGLVCDPSHNFTIGLKMALKARFREYPHTTQAVDTLFSDVEKIR